jgi:hypothetical protein
MINNIIIILFVLINIALAQWDADLIKVGKRIRHGINGIIYLVLIGTVFYFFKNYWLIAALIFTRLIFFNIFLNYFRGGGILYMPTTPKSIADKIANFVFFKNALIMYLVYLVALIFSMYKLCK